MMKKAIALLATAGMLTSPLAMAQNTVPAPQDDDDRPVGAVQASETQAVPQSGGSTGFAESIGVSNTTLAIGIASALGVAIAVAASSSSDSSSGTTGTTGTN